MLTILAFDSFRYLLLSAFSCVAPNLYAKKKVHLLLAMLVTALCPTPMVLRFVKYLSTLAAIPCVVPAVH